VIAIQAIAMDIGIAHSFKPVRKGAPTQTVFFFECCLWLRIVPMAFRSWSKHIDWF